MALDRLDRGCQQLDEDVEVVAVGRRGRLGFGRVVVTGILAMTLAVTLAVTTWAACTVPLAMCRFAGRGRVVSGFGLRGVLGPRRGLLRARGGRMDAQRRRVQRLDRGLDRPATLMAQHQDEPGAQMFDGVLDAGELDVADGLARGADDKEVTEALIENELRGHARVRAAQDHRERLLRAGDLRATLRGAVGVFQAALDVARVPLAKASERVVFPDSPPGALGARVRGGQEARGETHDERDAVGPEHKPHALARSSYQGRSPLVSAPSDATGTDPLQRLSTPRRPSGVRRGYVGGASGVRRGCARGASAGRELLRGRTRSL